MSHTKILDEKDFDQALTKNQKIVFNLLQSSGEPLKAYSILDSLKKEGLKSPLQVYRALDKLVNYGVFKNSLVNFTARAGNVKFEIITTNIQSILFG